jgi:hypothetical protein
MDSHTLVLQGHRMRQLGVAARPKLAGDNAMPNHRERTEATSWESQLPEDQ